MISKDKKNTIILLASSRSNGNTFAAVELVRQYLPAEFLNLNTIKINDFDYQHHHHDDFLNLLRKLMHYDTLILATPIYWYTMSAQMKRFVDRLSDLLTVEKELGRQLRKKNLAIITSYSVHPNGKSGFEPIWLNIANYLGMNYRGCYFHYAGEDEARLAENASELSSFIKKWGQV